MVGHPTIKKLISTSYKGHPIHFLSLIFIDIEISFTNKSFPHHYQSQKYSKMKYTGNPNSFAVFFRVLLRFLSTGPKIFFQWVSILIEVLKLFLQVQGSPPLHKSLSLDLLLQNLHYSIRCVFTVFLAGLCINSLDQTLYPFPPITFLKVI